MSEAPGNNVMIELIDSSTGKPLQSWHFVNQDRISIGRSAENDVVVSNPYVSRSHAYLHKTEGRWQAVAISHHQLMSEGSRKATVNLRSGSVFQLGPQGCQLRFGDDQESQEPPQGMATLAFDPGMCPILQLDRDQLQREVRVIVEGDYFQNLSRSVRQLREAKLSESPDGLVKG